MPIESLSIQHSQRLAVQFAVWRVTDRAARDGNPVDIQKVAEDLVRRYPDSGFSVAQVVEHIETAALQNHAPLFSERSW